MFLFRMVFQLIRLLIPVIIIVVIAIAGYLYFIPQASPLPPFPQLAQYEITEGEAVTQYLADLNITQDEQLGAQIGQAAKIAQCYQDLGGVRVQLYRHTEQLLNAGVVSMASRNALLNPANLATCLNEAGVMSAQARGMPTPCQGSYSFEKADDTIYVSYFATDLPVCQAFCTQLEGCTEHR